LVTVVRDVNTDTECYNTQLTSRSNLMKAIVVAGKTGARQAPGLCPSPELLREIGDLSFRQLATLRHKGALGTVAVTFIACCQSVATIQGPCEGGGHGVTLLDHWYKVSERCREESICCC
jgi:hypothetical protein